MDNFLRLLRPLSQGLDQLVHGRAGYEGPDNPPSLLQSHPDHLHLGVLTLLLAVVSQDGLYLGPHT